MPKKFLFILKISTFKFAILQIKEEEVFANNMKMKDMMNRTYNGAHEYLLKEIIPKEIGKENLEKI